MARKVKSEVQVGITAEADFAAARKDIKKDLDKIEKATEDTVDQIEDAFRKLSPDLDTSDIRKALDLADQLDGMVANFTVDTDLAEIQEAEKLAKSLRAFQGRVDLSVEGRAELTDALGLAEKMDQIRTVKVQVQGQQDLERAEQLARDLDGRKITIPIDARAEDLVRLDAEFEQAGESAGDAFADGFDITDIGGSMAGQLQGALALAGPAGAILGPLAAAWGDDFIAGMTAGFSSKKNMLLTELQTNFSAADLKPMGDAAGRAYADGFGEGLRELTVDAATLETALRGVDASMELDATLKSATLLSDMLGVELVQSSTVAARMIRQGLARDTEEAYDIMIYSAAQYGEVGVEAIELTKEFGGIMGRLGLDGPAAIDGISKAYLNGLLPTMDRGVEMWEEMNLMMMEGSSATREAVENLGLDFDEMQRNFAKGGEPARASIELITQRLLEMDDKTAMSTAAIDIWGMAIESATDRPETIAWINEMSKAQLDLAGTSDEATAKVEAMQSAWDRASRLVEEGGRIYGTGLAHEFNLLYDAIALPTDALGWLGDKTTEVGGVVGLLETPLRQAGDALSKTAGQADEMRLQFDDAADATKWLEGALGGLFDFSADQLFREVTEQGQALVETFAEAGSGAVDMAGNIDISTDAGRRLEAALEGMSGMAVDAAVALAEGRIEAGEYRDILNIAESAIRSAGAAAGLTAAQVDELTARYMDQAAIDAVVTRLVATDEATRPVRDVDAAYRALPDRVNADLVATDKGTVPTRNLKNEIAGLSGKTVTLGTNVGAAISSVKTLQQAINSLQGKTVTASVRQSVGFSTRAEGGPVRAGQPYIVGEEGQELYVPDQNGTIIDAARTRSLLATSAAAQSFIGSGASGAGGGSRTVLELRSSGSAVDDFLVEMMRRAVANRGGVDVVFGRN